MTQGIHLSMNALKIVMVLLYVFAPMVMALVPHRKMSALRYHRVQAFPSVLLRSSYYDDDFDEDYYDDDDDDQEFVRRKFLEPYEWERYEGCDVCLPIEKECKALVHFIGGTGLGVFPRQSYNDFLCGLAEQGFAILATPLPVFVSPLDHSRMVEEIADVFQLAYHEVIEDEYGEEKARDLPIIGLGHSLGSRLHVILNCMENSDDKKASKKDNVSPSLIDIAYPRDANILISFNNYPTNKSVPLLDEMNLISNGVQRSIEASMPTYEKLSGAIGKEFDKVRNELEEEAEYDSDAEFILKGLDFINQIPDRLTQILDDGRLLTGERRSRRRRRTRGGRDGIAESQLIPTEFNPSPDELWDDVERGRYGVEKNLFVQMDSDRLDQTSRLASFIKAASSNSSGLRYAYLGGGHLTPIKQRNTYRSGSTKYEPLDEDGSLKQLDDLISSVSSYIGYIAEEVTSKPTPK